MQDSASIDFATPFTGTISLSTNDFVSQDKTVHLYPNPVKDLLHFSEEVSNVKITDLSGKMVKQITATAKSVDVSKLSKGNYIITIVTKKGQTVTRKFIKD